MTEARTRIEHDALGPVAVPAERLWGAQTERSREHFPFPGQTMPRAVVHALALIKKVAAEVNVELGVLDARLGQAIAAAGDEVLAGRHEAEFPLAVWQTGSGTQTNMNVNEVLANRASELLGGPRGEGRLVHPNDHVNRSQSSNDAFPTAMSLAALNALTAELCPALRALRDTLVTKSEQNAQVIKLGRTHLMDATPLTLGQEIGGWAQQLTWAINHVESSYDHLAELAIGGTAVGTGLNAPAGFAEKMASRLGSLTGLPLHSAPNKFEALAAHDALVFAHGALKTTAAALTKIGNDVRWLASGPRSAIGEISLPENEPGSSIMPGKVNPTQAESLLMVAARVFGNDVSINLAGASGNFELNVQKPLLIHCFLESAELLSVATRGFDRYAAQGITANLLRIQQHLANSLMLVTALTPHIGYEAAARIAQRAHRENTTLAEAALAEGVAAEDFARWADPRAMLGSG